MLKKLVNKAKAAIPAATKAVKKAVPQAARTYEKQLMEEINEDRNEHDKKPFDDTKPPKDKIYQSQQQTLKAEYFTKVSIRNALHIQRRQAVIKTVMYWMLR